MAPEEILDDLRKQPFEPFRMTLADGTIYDIHHPDQCIVTPSTVILGLYLRASSKFVDKTMKLDCHHILRVEPLDVVHVPGAVDHGD